MSQLFPSAALFLTATLVLSAGCASASVSPQSPASEQSEQPKYGGYLINPVRSGTVTIFNPYAAGVTVANTILNREVWEPLIMNDSRTWQRDYRIEFRPEGFLAEKWQQLDQDGFQFQLRKGAKWHDGAPFTADDVVWSFNYPNLPENKGKLKVPFLNNVKSVEKVDDLTVKVLAKAPNAAFLEELQDWRLLPKHIADKGISYDLPEGAIGTGPFKIAHHQKNVQVVTGRHDGYWEPGRPYLDGTVHLYGMDRSTIVAAFMAGKVDIHQPEDAVQLQQITEFQKTAGQAAFFIGADYGLMLKLDRPPFNDIRVRRALHLGIDRQDMRNTAGGGQGAFSRPGAPGMYSVEPSWTIPDEELLRTPGWRQPKTQDIAEAKRLLAEAGYGDGLKVRLKYRTSAAAQLLAAEGAAAQLRQNLGVDVTLVPQEGPVDIKDREEGNYEIIIGGMGDKLRGREMASLFQSTSDPKQNSQPVRDPDLDRILQKIQNAWTVGDQKAAFIEAQRYLMDKVYYVPMIDFVGAAVWQEWVHNYSWNLGGAASIQVPSLVWMDVARMPARAKPF